MSADDICVSSISYLQNITLHHESGKNAEKILDGGQMFLYLETCREMEQSYDGLCCLFCESQEWREAAVL